MPLLSIVVPAYRVQAYIGACLDSLLTQSFTDIEVIAVDDCSPDRTGALLDGYAERDHRVRVLHLPANVGLGPARNAGLAMATGKYVWFVDSDDWVEPHCLRAIAGRLAETAPEVLVVDYARVYWNLRVVRNTASRILTEAPDVFRAADYPELCTLFPGAWSKIVRRDLLRSLDIAFPAGYYEDLPFTFPLLCAADRIAVLDRVCLFYRQRRHGSILRTSGERHLVLLNQYELVYDRLAALGDRAAPLLPAIYTSTVRHLLGMLGRHGRIGDDLRRTFYQRASALCQRYRPAGWRPPSGIDGIRYRLVEAGSWPSFAAARRAYQTARPVAARLRRARTALTRRARRVRRLATKAALRGYYRFQTHLPLDDRLAVYSIYWGKGYGCNCAAIYEKARQTAPEIRGVWIVTRAAAATMPPGVDYAVIDTPAYFRVLARARYLFNNVNYPDFLRKRPGTVHVQTHHGTPLKAMGVDQQRSPALAGHTNFANLLLRCDRWDYSISANAHSSEVWERAYPSPFETLEYGYPRNDVLVGAPPPGRAALRAELGIGPDERVLLYAPTHREYRRDTEPLFDYEALVDAVGPGTRLLVRAHHFERHASSTAGDPGGAILDVSHIAKVELLYLAADVLITDYSSVMFDFAVLDRPVVIFAPDWQAYRFVRGAYFDLLADPPGVVARDQAELVDAVCSGAYLSPTATEARARFRKRFCAYDDGHAAERVVQRVFRDEEPAPPIATLTRAAHALATGGPTAGGH